MSLLTTLAMRVIESREKSDDQLCGHAADLARQIRAQTGMLFGEQQGSDFLVAD
jgi:hypothetical protein